MLLTDLGRRRERDDRVNHELVLDFPPPVIRLGKNEGVGGVEQQGDRFEDRGLPGVATTEHNIHPGGRIPVQGLDTAKPVNLHFEDLCGRAHARPVALDVSFH